MKIKTFGVSCCLRLYKDNENRIKNEDERYGKWVQMSVQLGIIHKTFVQERLLGGA